MANPGNLQFDRAEPTTAAAPTSCTVCKQPLQNTYYAINGRAVCPSCRDKVALHAAGGSFANALLLGLGAAALGAGIYFGIEALTGYEFGLVAVVVGLLVGNAVRKGSRGAGGWRYQALAIGLTYLSVVVTDSSLMVRAALQERGARIDSTAVVPFAHGTDSTSAPAIADSAASAAGAPSIAPTRVPITALLVLLGLALAMPFLIGFQAPLHFVIVAFALYEAWKLNRAPIFNISGPFQMTSAPAAPAP